MHLAWTYELLKSKKSYLPALLLHFVPIISFRISSNFGLQLSNLSPDIFQIIHLQRVIILWLLTLLPINILPLFRFRLISRQWLLRFFSWHFPWFWLSNNLNCPLVRFLNLLVPLHFRQLLLSSLSFVLILLLLFLNLEFKLQLSLLPFILLLLYPCFESI